MRTEPIRNFTHAFRSADLSGSYDPSDTAGRPNRSSWSDVVSRGVELGYQLVEDQIRQGQRVAGGLNGQPYDLGRIGDDLWEATERTFRYWSAMTNVWMQLVTGMSWMGAGGRPWERPAEECPPEEDEACDQGGWRRVVVAVEVDSRHPVSVELDLHTPDDTVVFLAVVGLHSMAGHPPLTEIAFESGRVREGVRLRLRIPDDQPPGFYTGAVFEQHGGRPQGTLSVRVSERDA